MSCQLLKYMNLLHHEMKLNTLSFLTDKHLGSDRMDSCNCF